MFLVPKMTLSLLCVLRKNQKSPQLIFDTHLPFSKLRSFVTCVSDRTKPHSGKCPHLIFQKNLLLTKIFQMDFQTNNPHKRIFPPKSKVCKCILYCKMSNFGKRKSFFSKIFFFQDLSNRQCTCNGWKVVCLWSKVIH